MSLVPHDIESRAWRFERHTGEVLASYMRLLAGGRLSGFRNMNEWRWALEHERLVFYNVCGQRSTIFSRVSRAAEGALVLEGEFRPDPTFVNRLVETRLLGTPISPDAGDLRLTGVSGGRRNLVVLRANEASLHTQWPRDIEPDERNWDLCISHYGDPSGYRPDPSAEFNAYQANTRKFRAIHALFHAQSALWNYERIMLLDDDLFMSWKDVNTAFELAKEHQLELAQPAVRPGSHVGLEFVLQQPGVLLRFTNFVETMMPIFSREALKICVPTFADSHIGWGLDAVWGSLLAHPVGRMGIIDAISFAHTRPLGASYEGANAASEAEAAMKQYGVALVMKEFGRILL